MALAPSLKDRYDVVIIGAGVHWLALTAYYLGNQGVTNVAVLDKGYLGSGNSGRNTAIIRANYRTPEGIPFYHESVRLYETLSQELGYNVLFSQQGHLTLAHTRDRLSTVYACARRPTRSWESIAVSLVLTKLKDWFRRSIFAPLPITRFVRRCTIRPVASSVMTRLCGVMHGALTAWALRFIRRPKCRT